MLLYSSKLLTLVIVSMYQTHIVGFISIVIVWFFMLSKLLTMCGDVISIMLPKTTIIKVKDNSSEYHSRQRDKLRQQFILHVHV